MRLESRSNYATILRDNTPILDVRAPREFDKGTVPNSINIPILSDEERHLVGIEYEQNGNQAAVDLGKSLVGGEIKTARVQAWCSYLNQHPNAVLTCWRGGQRSQIAQQWLDEISCEIPRLAGGFKAMRQCSLDVLEYAKDRRWVVVSGSTGVGKTLFLNQYDASVDLEGLANHRGSAFGRTGTPQPAPVSFEIGLAQQLLQTADYPTCLVEDESRTIGRLAVPANLHAAMENALVVVLEKPDHERVELTYEHYVRNTDSQHLVDALARIKKRLGNERYNVIATQLYAAINADSKMLHSIWIGSLLKSYYDPMYDYQLKKKQDRIIFRGGEMAVCEYLANRFDLRPQAAD